MTSFLHSVWSPQLSLRDGLSEVARAICMQRPYLPRCKGGVAPQILTLGSLQPAILDQKR